MNTSSSHHFLHLVSPSLMPLSSHLQPPLHQEARSEITMISWQFLQLDLIFYALACMPASRQILHISEPLHPFVKSTNFSHSIFYDTFSSFKFIQNNFFLPSLPGKGMSAYITIYIFFSIIFFVRLNPNPMVYQSQLRQKQIDQNCQLHPFELKAMFSLFLLIHAHFMIFLQQCNQFSQKISHLEHDILPFRREAEL